MSASNAVNIETVNSADVITVSAIAERKNTLSLFVNSFIKKHLVILFWKIFFIIIILYYIITRICEHDVNLKHCCAN